MDGVALSCGPPAMLGGADTAGALVFGGPSETVISSRHLATAPQILSVVDGCSAAAFSSVSFRMAAEISEASSFSPGVSSEMIDVCKPPVE